jgi:hypothetical protein
MFKFTACSNSQLSHMHKFRLSLAAQLRRNQGIAHAGPQWICFSGHCSSFSKARGRWRPEPLRQPSCSTRSVTTSTSHSQVPTSYSQHTSQHRIHILSSNTGHIAVRSQHLSDVCVCRCCCWRRYVLQAGVVLLPSALLSSPGRCCAAVGFPGRMNPRGMKTRHVPMAHEST